MSDGLSLETHCDLKPFAESEWRGDKYFGVMKSVCGCFCVYVCEKGRGRQTQRGKKEETVVVSDFERCDCSLN